MRSRNGGDIDFLTERTEDHLFAIKRGDRGYSSEDKNREQPDLTLGKLDCTRLAFILIQSLCYILFINQLFCIVLSTLTSLKFINGSEICTNQRHAS